MINPAPSPVQVEAPAPRPPALRRVATFTGRSLIAIWKFLVGVAFTQTFLGSIFIIGWTYRLVQRVILKSWWKQSDLAVNTSFPEFASADPAHRHHQHWPNWLLQQNRAWLSAPRVRGFSKIRAIFKSLFHSLWLNVKFGSQMIFNTWVLTLPGCVLMLFSWYAGWHNSFNKGYEQAAVGPLLGLSGIAAFIAAMYYVPMAQMRHASTGDWRAFYQFSTVWKLVRKQWLACFGLALLYTTLSLPVTILKTIPGFFPNINPALADLPPAQALQFAKTYYFYAAFALFAIFVLLRIVAARIYASAILASVQSGALTEESLGDKEWEALHRLDLLRLKPQPPRHFLVRTITWCGTRLGRATVGVALFLVWFTFIAQVYVSEFFLRSEHNRGWLNQPLVQLPWFNYIPPALEQAAAEPFKSPPPPPPGAPPDAAP